MKGKDSTSLQKGDLSTSRKGCSYGERCGRSNKSGSKKKVSKRKNSLKSCISSSVPLSKKLTHNNGLKNSEDLNKESEPSTVASENQKADNPLDECYRLSETNLIAFNKGVQTNDNQNNSNTNNLKSGIIFNSGDDVVKSNDKNALCVANENTQSVYARSLHEQNGQPIQSQQHQEDSGNTSVVTSDASNFTTTAQVTPPTTGDTQSSSSDEPAEILCGWKEPANCHGLPALETRTRDTRANVSNGASFQSYSPLLDSSSFSLASSCLASAPQPVPTSGITIDGAAHRQKTSQDTDIDATKTRDGGYADLSLSLEAYKFTKTFSDCGVSDSVKISSKNNNSISIDNNISNNGSIVYSQSGCHINRQETRVVRGESIPCNFSHHLSSNNKAGFHYTSDGGDIYAKKSEDGILTTSLLLPTTACGEDIDIKPDFEPLHLNTVTSHHSGYNSEYHQHLTYQQHHYQQQRQQFYSAASPPEHRLYPDNNLDNDVSKHSSPGVTSVDHPSTLASASVYTTQLGETYFTTNGKIPSVAYNELTSMSYSKPYPIDSDMSKNCKNVNDQEDPHAEHNSDGRFVGCTESFPSRNEMFYQDDPMQHNALDTGHPRHSGEMMRFHFDSESRMSSYSGQMLPTTSHDLYENNSHLQLQSEHHPSMQRPQSNDHIENLTIDTNQHCIAHNNATSTDRIHQHRHAQHPYEHHHNHHSQLQHHLDPHHSAVGGEEQQHETLEPSSSMANLHPLNPIHPHHFHHPHQQVDQEHASLAEDSSNNGNNINNNSDNDFKFEYSQRHLHSMKSASLPLLPETISAGTSKFTATDSSSSSNSNSNIPSYHLTSISPATAHSDPHMYPTPPEAAVAIYPHQPQRSHYHYQHMQLQNLPQRENAMYSDQASEGYSNCYDEASTPGHLAGISTNGMDLASLQPFPGAGIEEHNPAAKEHHSHHHSNEESSHTVDSRKPMAMIYPWMKKTQTGKCK
ncbi:hypothetical protein ElyMa_001985000 [Elysia marginata]|uniref:Homeobox domain-containing protein n=1 Tax=Elysia marginata TaxID=1093978 RepID=A0AAV4F2H1_9GAST|nr:hypothetical protein ElyMa_001985000 [Elysia marginata]